MTINEFLQTLKPSGEGSFEALIGKLLGALTGLHFYVARSGDQGGRDGRAAGSAGGEIVYECKRYSAETSLRDRELLGELAQAQSRLPELDVWIIAASRDITDQNLEPLQTYGRKHGIDVLALESRTDGSGSLDFLVASFPEVVQQYAELDKVTALKQVMEQAANQQQAQSRLAELKRQFLRPDAGWPAWRENCHQEWNRTVNERTASRSRFGQPLDVSSGECIPRKQAEEALDAWWSNETSSLFAMTGEEGDGKSWAVAQWLTNQIGNTLGRFPPIVFIPSRDAGSAKTLEDLVIENVHRLLPNGEWKSKLTRWLEFGEADGKQPVAVVVLDGLNERHSPDDWRKVIEATFDKPWAGRIRLICTARNQYWDEYFAKRRSIPSTRFKLQSFSDGELQLALNGRGLKVSDFPEDLRPLLRKPRYFDLAATYRDQMAESGDFTLARLYFEDWRDRCDRSDREMSENGFNDFLRQIAEKYRDGVQQLATSDVLGFIGFDADSRNAFRELATGGVLERKSTGWIVSEGRLPMALGLLLSDELSSTLKDANLTELIAKWLEPHTGSDLEALIIEFAVLASVSQNASSTVITALLRSWIETQNPQSPAGDPIERRLVAYMPECLDAYTALAKSVWSDAQDHPWAQEVLIRGFSFWIERSTRVAENLVALLTEWLSMVPSDGPPMFRRVPFEGPAPRPNQAVRTLWPEAVPNRDYEFNGYLLRVIDDDGWLRLSHVAYVILSSFEDRRPLVQGLVQYCIAKAIHESADGQNELRWVIRSSKFDLEPWFLPHIERLLDDQSRIAQWACSRLLRAIGTESAWQILERIDEDAIYPPSGLEEERLKNPVESIFQCTIRDLEEYAVQENFKAWSFIQAAEAFAADTDMHLSAEVAKRLETYVGQLDAKPVWQGQWKSGEDHFFEKAEIVLARVDPQAIANIIRRIVKTAPSRQVEPLYSLAFRLQEYDLLFDDETRLALESARENNPAIQGPADSKGMHCEFFLFSRVLPLWSGTGQLEKLLARRADANDWIDFENSYRGPVIGELPRAKSTKDWFRTLFYLSVLAEDKLSSESLQSAYETEDSLVRGSLFRYLFFCESPPERSAPFISQWSWKPEMHHMEQTFGSLLLIRMTQQAKSSAPWRRVDPTFGSTALNRVGSSQSEWAEYCTWFMEMITALQVRLPEEDVPAYEITYTPQETGRPGRVALAPEPKRSVRMVTPESHWGGRSAENPWAALTEEPDGLRQRTKAKIEQLHELIDSAVKLGNFWLQRCFPRDAIELMFVHAPAVIDGSLRSLFSQEVPTIPFAAVSYYIALAEVLFSRDDRLDDAVTLMRVLRSMNYGTRIIDADTNLDQLDLDAFGTPAAANMRTFWEEELIACSSDLDLLELVIKVRHSLNRASETWLNGLIARDLSSTSAFERARAVCLRGFMEAQDATQWLGESISDDDSWPRMVLKTAQRRVKMEIDARYWFKRFCEECDLDKAWAAFRLFLTITDRRCWLWCSAELSTLDDANAKCRFFRSNRDEIRKACKDNEEKLQKTFVGCEIVDQMYPWCR